MGTRLKKPHRKKKQKMYKEQLLTNQTFKDEIKIDN
jgi:hypothetical protein